MRNIFLVGAKLTAVACVVLFLSACSTNTSMDNEEDVVKKEVAQKTSEYTPESMLLDIQKMEKLLSLSNTPDKAKLRVQLVEFYDSYSQLFSGEKNTAEMLFKAGNESVSLMNYDDALAFYDRIDNHYSEFIKRPESIYLQGFIYESYKGEFGKAKEKYERVMVLFPRHILADQAKQSIANLGLTDEEIIRKFEKEQGLN